MNTLQLDSTDRKLLNLLQTDFPLSRAPYSDIGVSLGIDTDETIRRIERLKENKIIRMIGPVLDARSLGYHTTLAAMKVLPDRLEETERLITVHPGVSHGYERDHEFNVWFTLAVSPAQDIETELQKLGSSTGAGIVFSLPAVKIFKIGVYFDMEGTEKDLMPAGRHGMPAAHIQLFAAEKKIINGLQQDLPLSGLPFSEMAEKAGMDEAGFLNGCRQLRDLGVIRRFGASINHRVAGFNANAMSCWTIPGAEIAGAAKQMASFKEVSHCYERMTNRYWRHNIFAMIHGRSREECAEIAANISRETGVNDYAMLFSTKEFKKTRIKYQV